VAKLAVPRFFSLILKKFSVKYHTNPGKRGLWAALALPCKVSATAIPLLDLASPLFPL
jgi:hypothetical protein